MEDEKQPSEGISEKEETPDELTGESKETTESSTTADKEAEYEAELARLKEENDRFKDINSKQSGAIREERRLRRELEKKLPKDQDEEEETRVEPDIKNLIKSELDKQNKTRNADLIEEILDEECTGEKEKELVSYIYRNRLNPSGFTRSAIRRDLRDARLLANRALEYEKEKAKIRKSAAEKAANVGPGEGSSHPAERETGEYSATEKRFLRRYGVEIK